MRAKACSRWRDGPSRAELSRTSCRSCSCSCCSSSSCCCSFLPLLLLLLHHAQKPSSGLHHAPMRCHHLPGSRALLTPIASSLSSCMRLSALPPSLSLSPSLPLSLSRSLSLLFFRNATDLPVVPADLSGGVELVSDVIAATIHKAAELHAKTSDGANATVPKLLTTEGRKQIWRTARAARLEMERVEGSNEGARRRDRSGKGGARRSTTGTAGGRRDCDEGGLCSAGQANEAGEEGGRLPGGGHGGGGWAEARAG